MATVQEVIELAAGEGSFPRGVGQDVYFRLSCSRTGNSAQVKIVAEKTAKQIIAEAKKALKSDVSATRRQNRAERINS